jgi:hypothetical protein
MSQTFEAVFERFKGPAEVGRAIGVTTEHAVQMRRRGSIPPQHWQRLVEAACERGVEDITFEFLAAARAQRSKFPAAPPADAAGAADTRSRVAAAPAGEPGAR